MGKNVKRGSDDTIYAMADGVAKYSTKSKKHFDGSIRVAKVVSVEPVKEKVKAVKPAK